MAARHASSKPAYRRWIRNALLLGLLAVVGLCAFAVLSGAYQVRPILSGSMRPGLPVGGVVITKRVPVSSLHVRDVVVLHRPDKPDELVVHRIISMTPGPNGVVVQTQGDANDVKDPWTVTLKGTTAYRAVYTLPLVGYAAVWVHNPTGRRVLFALGGLLLVGVAASGIIRARHRSREPQPDHDATETSSADDAISDASSTERREPDPAPVP
jgi:signal peptidase I